MKSTIAAFYRFTPVSDTAALQRTLKAALTPLGLRGTLLIAPEGINGTLAGTQSAVDALLALLHTQVGLPRDDVKFSEASEMPFHKLKIRQKREIITFGHPEANPATRAGEYVAPPDWNALIADPDVLVLDTRNRYETRIGSFADAVDPGLDHFSEFAAYVREHLDPARQPKVAMFCTGGIRCEKASAFLRQEGFAEVYHLKGGILKYLEEVPAEDSRWQGECYVFDHRMAVGHGLTTGRYAMCFACGEALSEADRADPRFEEGASCPLCYETMTEADRARFRMRHAHLTAAAATH